MRALFALSGLLFVLPAAGVCAADATPPAGPAATPVPAPGAPLKSDDGATQLTRGNPGQALADYTEALKDTGLANDRRANILNDRAVAYVRLGQAKLALEDFNRAIGLFAEYPAAYNNRGNLLLALGQYSEAIKDFDRAVILAPGYAAAYSNRANARLKLGQHAEAIRDFTKSIELMPASAPPLSGRGLAHLALGRPHAAIRDFSRAVNADARFASAYRNRAEARLDVGQNDEAIEDLSRAIAFDTNNAEVYVVRGYGYLAASNSASAIKDFSRAIELDPKSVSAYQARGLANGLFDAFDDAYGDLNRAIELDPRAATAFAYRAFIYKQNGQVDVALKDIETAVKLDPDRAEVLWARGEIEEARGQADIAVQSLRKSLALKPEWKFAADALKRLGATTGNGEEHEVAGAGIAGWKVVQRGGQFFAASPDFAEMRVPLEMLGEGRPMLIEWELKKPPHKGYGVLRFSGGQVAGKSGPEDTELAAIIDVESAKVIAIQPHRQGAKVAAWTWEDERVQVASIDGVTDEFQLRTGKPQQPAMAPGAPSGGATAERNQPDDDDPAHKRETSNAPWAQWSQPNGNHQTHHNSEPRQQQVRRAPSKPKTLFDLLFN